ncbi:MAG: ATP-binding protein [Sulfuricurvum sp.]|jgi:hypothetical protein|uniref:AAA family ATPase n=1 Tax=Sulfuricurvum sp. TaxID=2025608 RepID=UPI0025FE6E47|nr:ATP-binding protein [Sulfuricurvum sp.]MCK9373268.1 ATP-binding protein [Sulfuricurvum sp.]
MILEFGAKNFYSFKEGFEINLRSNDQKTGQNVAFNVLAIKGANASGKTNVLKLLQFIQSFVLNSFSEIKPEEKILIRSFFRCDAPIEIFIAFLQDNIEYSYELILTEDEVISEKISRKQKRDVQIIQREKNTISTISEFDELKTIKIRSNVSIISMALQYEINCIKPLAQLFQSIKTNVSPFGRNEQPLHDHDTISKFYYDNQDIFEFVIKVLKQSDTGIDNIKILDRQDDTGNIVYFPIFYFRNNSSDSKILTFYEQSSGTKSLYLQLGNYAIALRHGRTLILDEFDINLHPDILPMLVDFFDDPVKNVKNAQLIFTTHNTDIMDKLGKYRVVLVNKEDNESFLYRLDEIPGDILRNDRPITPIYKAGKIGGKPKLTA